MDGDMVPECKKKLARLRIKELKDVLRQLGLARTGRKQTFSIDVLVGYSSNKDKYCFTVYELSNQELVDRVLALLSDEQDIHGSQKNNLIGKEGVAKIIDDAYRKMQHTGAMDSGNFGHRYSESSSTTEIMDQKIRCPCGIALETELMIQCADPHCHVLQHSPCVIVPVAFPDEIPLAPSQFYCELCRINRADPFWKTLAHILYPAKLRVSSTLADGSRQLQKVEKGFRITTADVDLLGNVGYEVQAWCILLNDSIPFRMHWPHYPDLRVNGFHVRTINRHGSKALGTNGRDDGPSISMYIVEGYNKISLSGSDTRSFCLGVRLVKKRTIHQVVNMIPSEEEGESFTDALARVRRCVGGGMDASNGDSDLEIIADNVTINLRCPMSGSRMKNASRFKECHHLGCFDLDTFVEINERSKKWQCPICLKNYSLNDIIIDPYMNRIVQMMQACDEDVTEIDVRSDGSWRAKIKSPFMNLEQWHLPDGSLCISSVKVDSNMEVSARKTECQLAIYENRNGFLNVGMPQEMHAPSSRIQLEEYFTTFSQEITSVSSSSSENVKENGLQSVTSNKDGVMDSMPYNYNQSSGITNRSTSSQGDPNVIVLSDSEEKNHDSFLTRVDPGTKPKFLQTYGLITLRFRYVQV